MAENTNDTATKAEKERLDAFYKDHKAPSGHQVRVVGNRFVVEPVKKGK